MDTNLGNEHHQALPNFPLDIDLANDLLASVLVSAEVNKAIISNLAFAASEELLQMAQEEQPLWLFDEVQNAEILNSVEYKCRFSSLDATLEEVIRVITTGGSVVDLGLQEQSENGKFPSESCNKTSFPETEASRATAVVYADAVTLVDMFINEDQWSDVFSNIVSRSSSRALLSSGDLGSPHGVLHVVKAEFHVPSPLVRTWEFCFARYCRQLAINTWLVADVSLESIFPNLALRCQRRPSGCLIQGLHDGISKVTWVENNAVSMCPADNMFRPIVKSGFAFGAKRWTATLVKQYDRNACMDGQFHQFPETKDESGLRTMRSSLLKLAGRMVKGCTANVTSCSENSWRPLPITGAEHILFKTRFNVDDPGVPQGVAVTIASSIWLPFPQVDVFNFLSNTQNRNKWDMLSHGRVVRDIERISSGRDPANWVSIVLLEPAEKKMAMAYVQETFTDSAGLHVVYAPIDMAAMDHILAGKDPDVVSILPCGFSVLPGTGGSILTIVFEIIDEEASTAEHIPPKSVLTARNIIMATVHLIKDGLSSIDNLK